MFGLTKVDRIKMKDDDVIYPLSPSMVNISVNIGGRNFSYSGPAFISPFSPQDLPPIEQCILNDNRINTKGNDAFGVFPPVFPQLAISPNTIIHSANVSKLEVQKNGIEKVRFVNKSGSRFGDEQEAKFAKESLKAVNYGVGFKLSKRTKSGKTDWAVKISEESHKKSFF